MGQCCSTSARGANGVIWEQTVSLLVEKTSEELIYIPGCESVQSWQCHGIQVFSRDYRETATASFVDFLQARNVPLGPEISPLQVQLFEKSIETGKSVLPCAKGIEGQCTVLVENMGEHIDAVLQPVIVNASTGLASARNTIKRGARKVLKLGDKEISYNDKFRLFMQTKLSNPHYPPEIQARGIHDHISTRMHSATTDSALCRLEQAQQSSHKIAALSVAKPSACNAVRRRAARMGSEAVDDFAKLEADVIRWLLAREDVQSSVHLALAGKTDEASDAILTIVKGLIDTAPTPSVPSAPSKQPKAKLAKRAATRPTKHEAPEKRARQEADEYWLDACSRAVEADRLHCEERHRAKRTSEVHVETPRPEPPQPLFWRIDMPDVLKVLSQRGVLPRNFLPVVRPHVTLLYIGGEGSEERAAARAGLSTSEFQAAKHTLEKLRGSTVAIKMTEIIIEENVACAFVDLPKSIPCGSKVPHLTLGTRQGVPARHANDILEEVREGRQEGITRIRLPKPKELRGVLDLETSATYSGKT
ncbi:Dynein alpha chain, flagellar outer arm [Symbiodinium microadriaticum]|uniref:Dynein alpha chain, flagellar outer arm n=1 Tax=Symbiodinium microadriaticum TaxID=2951 RepID=A0A1Q9D670_SYMMI|nr:Dynein alpha chain, flagellar outer arm [Symbiodinium microadriaticum]